MSRAQEILLFWFGDDPEHPFQLAPRWWKKDPEFDREIEAAFGADLQKAIRGEYDQWKQDPESSLALVILLDQFSRNIFRDTPRAFAQDDQALKICRHAMETEIDQKLNPAQRVFLYMPLMHSEDRSIQELSLKAFQKLAENCPEPWKDQIENNFEFARRHADIIFRFGRYPHRNKILNRPSTLEEERFLTEPGSSF